MRSALLSCLALATVLCAAAGTAHAQETDEDEPPTSAEEEAREHFEAGHEFYANAEYEDALAEFERAYELADAESRIPMLYNLGSTLERLGRFEDAARMLERYLDEADDPESPGRVRARIVSLRRRAAALSEATRDGADAEDGGDGLMVAAAVTLGIAGAGAVAFGVLAGLAAAEDGALADGCFAARSCRPEDVATLESLTLAADVSWIAAAAVGVVGVGLLIASLLGQDDDEAVARLAPVVGPSAVGLSVRGAL